MNNSDQAQKGFKTFVLTLSISLIVFSVLYYFISNSATDNDLNANIDSATSYETEEEKTVFGDLADKQIEDSQKAVLAGTTVADPTSINNTSTTPQTTQSTTPVPDSGVTSVTMGLIVSAITFAAGLYMLYRDPRKMALASFERRIQRDL